MGNFYKAKLNDGKKDIGEVLVRKDLEELYWKQKRRTHLKDCMFRPRPESFSTGQEDFGEFPDI